jgi:hypothetical protein
VPKRHTHDTFGDLECCDETSIGEKYCGFPRLDAWKKELL